MFAVQSPWAATITVTTTNDNGAGSLRQAILDANLSFGADTINFGLSGAGPFSINLTNPLPSVTETLTIDGTSQAGYTDTPRVELNGANAGDGVSGIYLIAPGCVVRGLAINRFSREGIRIEAFGSNVIQANFIGTGLKGTNSLGNGGGSGGFGGISIFSSGNLVGGTNFSQRNIVSGSNLHGILLLLPATDNKIQGNYIGVDVSGKRLGNTGHGLAMKGATGTLAGGTDAGAGNVISGNYQAGVYFESTANSNIVQGNFIGVSTNGTSSISNGLDGVNFTGGVGNQVGGTNAAARNIISGNGRTGVFFNASGSRANLILGNYIGTDAAGTNRLPNAASGIEIKDAASNVIGGTAAGAGNVISANGLSGVAITSTFARSNAVMGNLIGTTASGTNALGNSISGIYIMGATTNTIGGIVSGAGNVISGNLEDGIRIHTNCSSVLVAGNFIGTDSTGARRIGNANSGIRIESPSNFIGGTGGAAARNVVSGNTNSGIYILNPAASNNVVEGNYLGTDSTGTASVPNAYNGVSIENAAFNRVGGTSTASRNLISGNSLNGILIKSLSAFSNVVQGNYIGTDPGGAGALSNGGGLPVSEGGGGIDIQSAPSNLIGGTAAGAGNLISANVRSGIAIGDPGASNTVIQGNFIGTKADGVSQLGNEWSGIELRTSGGAANTLIGGTAAGAGNRIAFAGYLNGLNDRDGIRIRPNSSNTGNMIRGNSIFSNGGGTAGLGIDLDSVNGVNPNDSCDTDTGANQLQNYPVLSTAQSGGAVTIIGGSLNSAANSTFLIQFYANSQSEASGYGEGETFLGESNVTTGALCSNTFSVTLPVGVAAGQFVSATATDTNNNTSEFSAVVTVAAAQPAGIATQPASQVVAAGSNVTFSVTATGDAPLAYQWKFNGTNIVNATNSALAVPNAQQTNAGNYFVTVTNRFGATNSGTASLTIGVAPGISTQPQGQSAPVGSNVTFSVTATGTPAPSYQWRFNGTNISGATGPSLTLSNVQQTNAGNYSVQASNFFGVTNSANAFLNVFATPPPLAIQPWTNSQVLVSWASSNVGFLLQNTPAFGAPTVWTQVTNSPVISGAQFIVTQSATSGMRFYRLMLP